MNSRWKEMPWILGSLHMNIMEASVPDTRQREIQNLLKMHWANKEMELSRVADLFAHSGDRGTS